MSDSRPALFGGDVSTPTLPAGLVLVPEYLSVPQSDWIFQILESAHAEDWLDDLQRRVMHFGYRYDYRARKASLASFIGPLPPWVDRLGKRLLRDGYGDVPFDQMIVNEYLPGQGISAHVDCEPCFGSTIAAISLFSQCIMRFRSRLGTDWVDVTLPERSLVVMTGASRYDYTHEIAPRKSDVIDGVQRLRRRRVSLTFRAVVL